MLGQVYYTGCWGKCTTLGVGVSVLHWVLGQVYYTGCWCKCTTLQGVRASVSANTLLQYTYSETSLIRHSMGPENNVAWIRRLLDYGVPLTTLMYGDCTSCSIMVGLERMLDYRGV